MKATWKRLVAAWILTFWLCSCTSAAPLILTASPTPHPGRLAPYVTLTAPVTPTLRQATTATPLPSPSATPRTHTVVKDEDMFGIALRYHVTLPELMAANPEINPNFLSIGAVLIIPPSPDSAPSSAPPTPTLIPLHTGALTCNPTREGGAWCFLPVTNSQDYPVENISAAFRLSSQDGQDIREQTTYLALDVLAPGDTLPLAAYFPPPVPAPFQFSAELASSLPNPVNDGRYLAVRIENARTQIAADGLSAEADLEVWLDQSAGQAQRVWVVAVAYTVDHRVAGLRRWENENAGLQNSQALPVILQVYSTAGRIDHVEFFAQARP